MKNHEKLSIVLNVATICIVIGLVIVVAIDSGRLRKENKEMADKIESFTQQTNESLKLQDVQLENMETNVKKIRESTDQQKKDLTDLINKDTKWKVEIEKQIDKLEEAKKEKKEAEVLAQTQAEEAPAPAAIAPVTEVAYTAPSGGCLTPSSGVFWYGNQLETYYNLDMSVIVDVAHSNGISGDYWIRDDGCKMLGSYIMLACNRDVHPYGSLVETSLGTGISLDTGGFAAGNPYQVDVAVTW